MESSLVSQCLAFCQTLANQGKDFSINSSFSFSLDTRESKVNPALGKKRTSPSTQRRNARRREEFLRKKLNFSSVSHSASDSPADISPSVTAVETVAATHATSTPAIASTTAQEVNPVAIIQCRLHLSNRKTVTKFNLKVLQLFLPENLTHMSLLNQIHLRYSLGHVTGFVQIGAAVQRRLRRIHHSSSSCDKSDAVSNSYVLYT